MKVKLLDLPKISDRRGNLSVVEELNHVPFEIKRTFLLYDVPGGTGREGHAYQKQIEFIISLSGSFDVHTDDGQNKCSFSLNRSYYGLLIPQMVWRSMDNFSTNALCLVVSSTEFDESDYIRDYQSFKEKF